MAYDARGLLDEGEDVPRGILGYLPDDNAPLFLQAGMAPTPPSSFPLMLPAAPVPYPKSGDYWGAAPNAAAGPWSGSYLSPVPAAPDWGQVPTGPTANQAAIFATPSPLSWNGASGANPWGASNGYLPADDMPLFLQSGMAPTPPSFGKQPFAPLMSAHEVAALKTKNGVIVQGGRPDGPFTAFTNGLVDPFGMTSGLVGLALPEAGAAMSAQYANHPVAHAVGSALSPMIPGLGAMNAAFRYAPRTVATLLGLSAGMPLDEAGRDADQVDPLPGEINALETRIARNQAAAPQLDDQSSKPESDTPYMPPGFDQRPPAPQTRAEAASSPDIEDDQARLEALQARARAVAPTLASFQLPEIDDVLKILNSPEAFATAAGGGVSYLIRARRVAQLKLWEAALTRAEVAAKEGGLNSATGKLAAKELRAARKNGMTGGNWPEVPSALGGAAAGAVAAPIPYLKQDFEDGSLDLGNWDYWRNRVAPAAVIGAGYGGLSGLIGSGYKPVMPPKWQTNSLIGAPRVSRMPPGPSGLALLPAAGYSQPYQDQNGDWRFANPPTWPWR